MAPDRDAAGGLFVECTKLTILQAWNRTYSYVMTSTSERGEITSRQNAKEAEIIEQSKDSIAKAKRSSGIASTKNLAHRNQEQNDVFRAGKSKH